MEQQQQKPQRWYSGTLVSKPERATSKNGKDYARFRLAIQGKESTAFTTIFAYGSAVSAAMLLDREGTPCNVYGTLEQSEYNGKPQYSIQTYNLMLPTNCLMHAMNNRPAAAKATSPQPQTPAPSPTEEDDDIPF